jgi:hypothetical protein
MYSPLALSNKNLILLWNPKFSVGVKIFTLGIEEYCLSTSSVPSFEKSSLIRTSNSKFVF